MTSDSQTLLDEVIQSHGGVDRWNSLEAIEAEISASGALFRMKWRPAMKHVQVRAATNKPNFRFFDFPKPGQTSELVGADLVRILDADGNVIEERKNPRAAFRGLRRQLYWDDLDFIYFAGYATWNYLVSPFLLLHDGLAFELIEEMPAGNESWSGLRVTFSDDVPTHSKVQEFYFDEDRRLARLDYTAEVVGGWARAAHTCTEYRDFDGIQAPTRRRVRPLFVGTNPSPWPTLVAIDIHEVRPV